MTLKEEFLNLLEKDREFRLAVAGLIGLEEILKKLERNDQQIAKLRKDMLLGFKETRQALKQHATEIAKLRADMVEGFKRHDEILLRHDEEIAKLRADMVAGFKRHDEILVKHSEEIAKLREDMLKGFRRHDEEIAKLRADMLKGFRRHDEEIAKLRADMVSGFAYVERHISALGARWGIMSEAAFREGLRGILERELGLKVEQWSCYDERGKVFGYPSSVEVDVAVHDGKVTLIEVKSHVNVPDVSIFARKAELYAEKTGKMPSRKLMVTPFAEDEAIEAAKVLNIEVYTKV
ncbi:MAG: DUF3782 domain-containing protein [Nitrososphaerales archaeon]